MKRTTVVPSVSANASDDEEDSSGEVELVLPAPVRILESTSSRSILRNPLPLLQELQRNGHLQELTIIEQRRSLPVHELNGHHQHGEELKEVSTTSSPPSPPSAEQITQSVSNGGNVLKHNSSVILTDLLQSDSILHRQPPGDGTSSGIDNPSPVSGPQTTKRRTRKTISSNDPAKALTEMSVRGLNLFRYATVSDGMYQCLECVKEGMEKTFKNKYSFQRHAFLYHEGKQRKVFPCPVCNKEFSRPDKMKNHLRMVHESYEAKMEASLPSPSMVAAQQVAPLHVHPSQPQTKPALHHSHHRYQAEIINPSQLHEEQRRRQQEQDVLKIRSVVNAINLRQLQQLQQHAQEIRIRQTLQGQNQPTKPAAVKQVVEPPSVPVQLIHLSGIGSQ